MPQTKLQNYMRTHRKRAGLSQDEAAFLLGLSGGDKVSRYERRSRLPSLETVLAAEAVFGVPASELFAGLFEEVEEETRKRARDLAKSLVKGGGNTAQQKLARLSQLTGFDAGDSNIQDEENQEEEE